VTAERKYRLLVVDDDVSVLTTYRMILERHGYEVVACATSREAIDALAGGRFDAVLCDYSLENDHNGFEVVTAAQACDADVPIALLTGYATPEASQEAASCNVTILFKPIDIEEFLQTTARLVRRTG
jgi:DNA-binding NtrC family response regulator